MTQIIFILVFPAVAIYLSKKSKVFAWLSPVVTCYLLGIFVGNIPFLSISVKISKTITEITVLLAIPLLLFSTDMWLWLKLARKTVLSLFLAILGVIISSIISAQIFARYTDDYWKIAGMLIGVYTGGTPNMSAIGMALGVKEETFILLNGADVIIGGMYLIFLMTVARRILLLFLPPFVKNPNYSSSQNEDSKIYYSPYEVFISFLLSAVITAISLMLSFLIFRKVYPVVIILSVTTLGITFSFFSKIRSMKSSYDVGQYILLTFCVAVGTLARVEEILFTSPTIFYFCLSVLLGAIIIHFVLSFLFRIDADTTIIVSTAAIFSPAFVGPIAAVLKNREIVVSGIAAGLFGFAVGNYLGILIALILKP